MSVAVADGLRRRVLPVLAAAVSIGAPDLAYADRLRPDFHEEYDRTEPFAPVSERDFGLGMASIYLRYARNRDPDAVSGLSDLAAGGLVTRAVYGKRIGYGIGFDLELGAGRPSSFLYGFNLFPSGVAVALGPTGLVGLFLGIHASGVTGRVPMALMLPAELRFEFDMTRHARIGALFGVSWAPADTARRGGSDLLPFADETIMAVSARFGKTFPRHRANMGRGYFFRLERREQMRAVFLGLAFGVEIDVAQ
jgi:hypothetical protein